MVDVITGRTLGRLRDADRFIRRAAAEGSALVGLEDAAGRRAARRLLNVLLDADAELQSRLARLAGMGGVDLPPSALRAMAMRQQVRASVEAMQARLAGLTSEEAFRAIETSLATGADILAQLEPLLGGARAMPLLPIRQATAAARGSLLRVHESSVNRYGLATIADMEHTLAVGLASGLSSHELAVSIAGVAKIPQTVRRVVRAGQVALARVGEPLPGTYQRTAYRAERIVRTETARAYSVARMETIRADRAVFADAAKKILATFDNRTAYDSVAVHGQVRGVDDYFVDGAGREYPYPPGRPNDRETVIPWRRRWEETAYSREVPEGEREGRVGARARASIPRSARRAA